MLMTFCPDRELPAANRYESYLMWRSYEGWCEWPRLCYQYLIGVEPGGQMASRHVSLVVSPGELAFVGRNGAGKST